ncbi:MAG: hypothetical protein H6843_08365 [Rhodospirillaceae bacterium]|nr:hypothetical protein [Rhodospirillaceae bacterium]
MRWLVACVMMASAFGLGGQVLAQGEEEVLPWPWAVAQVEPMPVHVHQVTNVTIEPITIENDERINIIVTGLVNTPGWSNAELWGRRYYVAPEDGIYDFDFIAQPPAPNSDSVVSQVITPIELRPVVLFDLPEGFRGVRVHAASNSMEALVE